MPHKTAGGQRIYGLVAKALSTAQPGEVMAHRRLIGRIDDSVPGPVHKKLPG
jgi:hypothetical protein